jgi:ribosomal protein L11 methyltransferase
VTYWLEVAVACDGEAAEAVAELLKPLAYGDSVVLEQRSDANAQSEDALEPQVTVKIYLPGEKDSPDVRYKIREALYYLSRLYPIPEPTFRKLEDKDWAQAWKENYHPFRVGSRIWIQPSWTSLPSGAQPEDVVLTLDPGMAFGTGLHPTTQMCLRALPELVREGDNVLDVGTGSGILAIAAAKLGARRVLGLDTDAQAVRAAAENAERNEVSNRVEIRSGSLDAAQDHGWRVVIVNILAPVIVDMLQPASSRPGLLNYLSGEGRLLLSGIVEPQEPDVRQALSEAGGHVEETLRVRDWVSLIASRKAAV